MAQASWSRSARPPRGPARDRRRPDRRGAASPGWCRSARSIPGRPAAGAPGSVDRVDHQPRPAEGGDAELRVGLGPDRVVDLGDDLVDAERLGRQLGGHDVAVVALGQGQEDVGALGPGPAEDVLVGAVAPDRLAAEASGRRSKAAVDAVEDDDLVAGRRRTSRRGPPRPGRSRR